MIFLRETEEKNFLVLRIASKVTPTCPMTSDMPYVL